MSYDTPAVGRTPSSRPTCFTSTAPLVCIKEELPKLKLGRLRLWKEVKAKNRRSGRKMSDAIFVTAKASGRLKIGDKHEIDKATWSKPRGIRLTPTSRYIRDKLFPKPK